MEYHMVDRCSFVPRSPLKDLQKRFGNLKNKHEQLEKFYLYQGDEDRVSIGLDDDNPYVANGADLYLARFISRNIKQGYYVQLSFMDSDGSSRWGFLMTVGSVRPLYLAWTLDDSSNMLVEDYLRVYGLKN